MLAAFVAGLVVVAGALWFLGASAMDAGDRLFDGPQPGLRSGGCR